MAEERDESPNVRELARQGRLAEYYEKALPAERRRLWIDAYELLHVLTFTQLTRRIEARRGHRDCMVSVTMLRSDCLDRFHDDMEAVLDDVFRARTPIQNLEGWVSSRLTAVTIDAYRRRRGERGALQRPRIPRWLADELGHEKRLMELALEMLEWVGVEASAGIHDWPMEVWTARRAVDGGDYDAANRSVLQDVATVIAAMRRRPRWYAAYIERPWARKRLPLAMNHGDGAEPAPDPARTALEAEVADDARRAELADLAFTLTRIRIERGEDVRAVVVDVISSLFGSGSGSEGIDRVPGLGRDDDECVNTRLAESETVDRIVAVVLELLSR